MCAFVVRGCLRFDCFVFVVGARACVCCEFTNGSRIACVSCCVIV